jgi:hypothetical protein
MNKVADLVKGRQGWRLEPMATPGSQPAWCFVSGSRIEFAVTEGRDVIQLYVMETDREIQFKNTEELTAWLGAHRPEALQERAPRIPIRSRLRRVTGWG